VVHVAIDRQGSTDRAVFLQAADRHGHIVDHAESLAVVGEGVVKSSADVDGDFVVQAMLRSEDRSAGGKPEGFDEIARVGNFHLHLFARAERAGLQLLYVFRFVDQKDVLIVGGLWLEKIF
jgi:hypothetical protein